MFKKLTKQFNNIAIATIQLRNTIDTATAAVNALGKMFPKSDTEQDHLDFLDKIKDRMGEPYDKTTFTSS